MVIVLGFQPPHLGSIRAWVANAWKGRIRIIEAETGKEMHGAIFFFCFKTLQNSKSWVSDASLRDSNYVAAAFLLTKATYRCA